MYLYSYLGRIFESVVIENSIRAEKEEKKLLEKVQLQILSFCISMVALKLVIILFTLTLTMGISICHIFNANPPTLSKTSQCWCFAQHFTMIPSCNQYIQYIVIISVNNSNQLYNYLFILCNIHNLHFLV